METIVYVSAARTIPSERTLLDILTVSARNNAARKITGVLFYDDGNFMQALEGEEAVLDRLVATITRDPRHRNLIKLFRGPIAKRQFAHWSMAIRRLTDLPSKGRHGGFSLMESSLSGVRDTSTAVMHLLKSFQRSIR